MHLVGWIILAVIALILLLLLFTPLGVTAGYSGGRATVAARIMCFDLTLYPRPEKKPGAAGRKKAKKAKKPAEPKPDRPAKEKKPKPPLVTREMAPELLRLLGRTLTRFRKKLTVNRFRLHIIVAGDDPYDAVMAYGAINSAFATAGTAAGRAFNVRQSDVRTGLDFSAASTSVDAQITVTLNLARVLAVALAAGAGFLKIKRDAARAAKAAAKERKEKDGTNADPDGGISQSEHS